MPSDSSFLRRAAQGVFDIPTWAAKIGYAFAAVHLQRGDNIAVYLIHGEGIYPNILHYYSDYNCQYQKINQNNLTKPLSLAQRGKGLLCQRFIICARPFGTRI